MRRHRHLVLSLLLVTLVSFACVPQAWAGPVGEGKHVPKRDMKRQIEDLEQLWRTAQLAGDVPTLDRLLSDDFVGISLAGQVNTKTQQLDRYRKRTVQLTRLDLSDLKIKIFDSVAIVTSSAQVEGTNEGASLSGNYRYTRVYQRSSNGVWKTTNFEATRIAVPGRGRFRPDPADVPPPQAAPVTPKAVTPSPAS